MILTVTDVLIFFGSIALALLILGLVLARFKVPWETVMTILAGIVGMAMLLTFLGILLWWIQALPLILIVALVVVLLVYDWIKTVRYGENGAAR